MELSSPGSFFAGIVMVDEPANVGITTFSSNGDVLLTFLMRAGGDVSQIIMGLSANQALQLIERLQTYSDVYGRAVVEGKGGARFPDLKDKEA